MWHSNHFRSLRHRFEVLFGTSQYLPPGHAVRPTCGRKCVSQRHEERRNVCSVYPDESLSHARQAMGAAEELAVPWFGYQVTFAACLACADNPS